jgi:hypothetical protein
LSGKRCHGVGQRNRRLRGGAQREDHTEQREGGDKAETTQHGISPGTSLGSKDSRKLDIEAFATTIFRQNIVRFQVSVARLSSKCGQTFQAKELC